MRGHFLSLALAALVSWFIFDLLLDNYPPLVIADNPLVMSPQPVARNGALKVQYHITVQRGCMGVGRRIFIDAGNVPQPTVTFQTDTSEREDGQKTFPADEFDVIINATVPNGAAPGDATYQNQTTYYCNFWQRTLHRGIAVNFPVVDFKIGEETLPQVVPSTAIFKHNNRSDIAQWFVHRVGWGQYDQ